jgi:hypothetical protein
METKVGDGGGATRSEPTLPRKAGVKGRQCLLTTGGLIGVRRQASYAPAAITTNQIQQPKATRKLTDLRVDRSAM